MIGLVDLIFRKRFNKNCRNRQVLQNKIVAEYKKLRTSCGQSNKLHGCLILG